MPHWLDAADCDAILQSLLNAELAAYRGHASHSAYPSPDIDSLERLHLAARVNEFFCLWETGAEDRLLMTARFDDWSNLVADAIAHTSGLTFRTSGSTGAPTAHLHRWGHIKDEAEALAGLFANHFARTRIVSWLPLHHLYGFMLGVALPRMLGVPCVAAQHTSLPHVLSGDLIVTVPPRWDYLARSRGQWPDNVLGVSSTAPLAGSTSDALIARGLSGVLEIYGSTETGGVATRWQRGASYQLLSHWQCAGAQHIHRGDGSDPIALHDATSWHDDRTFTLGRRHDDVVSIGGVNVSLEYVAQRIRSLPAVADCAVRLTAHESQPRIKAFVVPVHNDNGAAQEIAAAVAQWPAAERPVGITFGSALPASEMGKAADW